jgi:uncharacterized damage-inducible protein DinB
MLIMLVMLQDLIYHKWYANASLIKVIRGCETAAQDAELLKILHHILLANRYWLLLSLGLPFALEEESRIPESLEAIAAQYRGTHEQEMKWVSQVQEPDLARVLESSFIPDHSCSVAQALMHVCLHSQGHRAQCATRLRLLGAMPPTLDFILWLKERPAPDWE